MFGFGSAVQAEITLSHCFPICLKARHNLACMFRWFDQRPYTASIENTRYHCPNWKPFRKLYLNGICLEKYRGLKCLLSLFLWISETEVHLVIIDRQGIKWWYFLLCPIFLWVGPLLTKFICFLFYAVGFSFTCFLFNVNKNLYEWTSINPDQYSMSNACSTSSQSAQVSREVHIFFFHFPICSAPVQEIFQVVLNGH